MELMFVCRDLRGWLWFAETQMSGWYLFTFSAQQGSLVRSGTWKKRHFVKEHEIYPPITIRRNLCDVHIVTGCCDTVSIMWGIGNTRAWKTFPSNPKLLNNRVVKEGMSRLFQKGMMELETLPPVHDSLQKHIMRERTLPNTVLGNNWWSRLHSDHLLQTADGVWRIRSWIQYLQPHTLFQQSILPFSFTNVITVQPHGESVTHRDWNVQVLVLVLTRIIITL